MVKKVHSDMKEKETSVVEDSKRSTTVKKQKVSDDERGNLKQVLVGFVIACFSAVLLAVYAADFFLFFFPKHKVEPYAPQNVYVLFNTTTQQPVDYEVYYTVARETWFTEEHVVRVKGKAGTDSYLVKLPVDKIYSLRLDFGQNSGAVLLNDVRLLGAQSLSLTNFGDYQYNQFDRVSVTDDGKLFLVSTGKDPYIIFDDIIE